MSGLLLELKKYDIRMEIIPDNKVSNGLIILFTKHNRNVAYTMNTILLTGSEVDASYFLKKYLHKFIAELEKDNDQNGI